MKQPTVVGCIVVQEVADSHVNSPTARGYITQGEVMDRALVRVRRDEKPVCEGYLNVLGTLSGTAPPPKQRAGFGGWFRVDAFEVFERFQKGDVIEVLESAEEVAARTAVCDTPNWAWRYRKST